MRTAARFVILAVAALGAAACATNIVAEKASRFDQGVAAYDAGDFKTAYEIWSQLAREDDLAAMRNTAQLLRQGRGVAQDLEKAFDLYKDAAEKGLVTAMANVAEMYLLGEGVEKNAQAAFAWYARAASAGLSLAQVKLAELYEQGIGTYKDPARARALIERAARNGYAPAQAKLRTMALAPPEDSTADAATRPDEAWQGGGIVGGSIERSNATETTATPAGPSTAGSTAAGAPAQVRRPQPGDALGTDASARMASQDLMQMNAGLSAYLTGNKQLAFASWHAVAVRGVAEAQTRVGLLYERGEGTGQDMIEAYRWLRLAAMQGDAGAQAELSFVSAQLAPAERAIGESLVRSPVDGPVDSN